MKGVPLEFGEFGEMPYYKRVPESHRVRRFQLGKLKIMTRDCEEEQEASRRRAVDEQEAIEQALLEHGNASRHITADALRQLQDDTPKRVQVHRGAPTLWKRMLLSSPPPKPHMVQPQLQMKAQPQQPPPQHCNAELT
eukprot:3383810-Amphidinium_carterae.1